MNLPGYETTVKASFSKNLLFLDLLLFRKTFIGKALNILSFPPKDFPDFCVHFIMQSFCDAAFLTKAKFYYKKICLLVVLIEL